MFAYTLGSPLAGRRISITRAANLPPNLPLRGSLGAVAAGVIGLRKAYVQENFKVARGTISRANFAVCLDGDLFGL